MKPNLVLFTSRQNDPTGCILVRKYQKIQSTDKSTILTNYNIYLLNFLIYNAKISDNNAESGKVPRMLAAFPR
jgi:hypothetical protein